MNSVTIKSADRAGVERAVRAYAQQLQERHPEVERILWFGSWVHGLPGPGSDVDLCLVLSHADKPFRERLPDYLPLGFPVGLDLFPYTRAELERLRTEAPGWYRVILSGRELFRRSLNEETTPDFRGHSQGRGLPRPSRPSRKE